MDYFLDSYLFLNSLMHNVTYCETLWDQGNVFWSCNV